MNNTVLIPKSTLIFALAFSLMLIALQQIQPLLIYERNSVLAGEAWRIVSGNFVHTNHYHLYINLAGFWLFLLLCGPTLRLKLLIFSIILNSTVVCSALFILHPEIAWYAGFSGVLYGLYIVGGICLLVGGEFKAFLALAVLITFKLASIWHGSSDELTQDMINANIIEEAHIYGALAGLVAGLSCFSKSMQPPPAAISQGIPSRTDD